MKITVPIATRGGNRLLLLRDFFTDQVPGPGGAGLGRGRGDRHSPRCVPKSPDRSPFSRAQGQLGLLWEEEERGPCLGHRVYQCWW